MKITLIIVAVFVIVFAGDIARERISDFDSSAIGVAVMVTPGVLFIYGIYRIGVCADAASSQRPWRMRPRRTGNRPTSSCCAGSAALSRRTSRA